MPTLEELARNHTGWIPYEQRTREQQFETDAWHEEIGYFEDVAEFIPNSELPDEVLYYMLEISTTGKLLPRPYQYTGSCVGVSGARAQSHAMLGDVVFRGEQEDVFLPFPFATYGIGREKMGARGPGSGSYGKVQAEAARDFGMVDVNFEKVPQPTIKDGWAYYSKDIELSWSHPRAWPVSRSEMESHANDHQTLTIARIRSVEGYLQAAAQGFGVTIASSFGTRPRIDGGYLIGDWNDSWAHQMSVAGYKKTPNGLLIPEDNQWGPRAHPECPFLSKIVDSTGNRVRGSYWLREGTMEKLCQRGEVYAITNTEGFRQRKLEWDKLSWFNFGTSA